MYIEINHGPSSFNWSLKASRQKSGLRLGLLTFKSLWVRSSFKRKISFENFATIAWRPVSNKRPSLEIKKNKQSMHQEV